MQSPVKKVAAIHDLSGFGRASLTQVIPILSRMGIQVCPLPTAVLSTHSKFRDFHVVDLTNDLQPIIDHWKELELEFDAIYSGFLGSHEQVDIVAAMIDAFRKEEQLVVVDPVLGDDGKIYKPLSIELVGEMKGLIKKADVITPNLTEAALLLDEAFPEEITTAEAKAWCKALSDRGPETVIITSVPEHGPENRTAVIAYDRSDNRYWKVTVNYIPASYPGTGDAFASVVTGAWLQGDSLPIALDRAVKFTSMGVKATFGYDYDAKHGILLERILHTLDAPFQGISYELI
jgi:pyridoxine kinase